ncbi:exporter of polyketide antibiotics [Actinoallomurus oryzae]|uniref:Exporter of polyketide antibiotics n=1 Tax=Actinoallomurus oryzae TaxID=502180 RepID=A0ABP8QQ80_9ACTN
MNALAGTGLLTRLAFRRDRVVVPFWIYLLGITAIGTAYTSRAAFSTLAKRADFAASVNKNPSMLALYGPVQDASIGSVSLWKVGGIAAALVGVVSLFLTVRHTRGDEESGRLELVSAGVIGRYAALTAGLITVVTTELVLAVLVSIGLVALGLPTAGSIAFALGWFTIGLVFAAVAAVTAQLTTTSRTASGLAIAFLGLCYLIRAGGDVGGHDGPTWLLWLSPFGWMSHLRPYAGDDWWVIVLPVAFSAVCVAVAFALVGRRDIGAGLLPDRLGPAEAGAGLGGPLGLSWRLQRGSLFAWAAGFAVYGAAIGGVTENVEDMIGGSNGRDVLEKLGGGQGMVDAFTNAAMSLMALLASAYAVQAVLRLRSEETGRLAEPILATKVGRVGWALGHVLFAVVGPAVLMALEGVMVGLVHGLRSHDLGDQFPRIFWSAIVQLPAVWVIAGITVALFGFAPRLAVAAWGLLGVFLLLGELGPLLELKQWEMDLSPFTHVPKLPGAPMRTMPVVWLIAVAGLLTAAGLAAFRRRDLS